MPLLALLLIVVIALIIVRIGAKALMMTGLSRDVADFQAISCFFGVGFTTSEAEMIVGHPVRRKIASHLIIAGNIGLTGALSTLVVTFVQGEPDWFDHIIPFKGPGAFVFKLVVIGLCVAFVAIVFRMWLVQALLDRVIEWSLMRFQGVRAVDYETVLRCDDGFAVVQIEIEPGHELIGRTLAGGQLASRGALVLGIRRSGGEYIGTPHATTELYAGDVLTIYGREGMIRTLFETDPLPG